MPDAIAQFAQARDLSLETFRKTGVGVRTPVWFAQPPDKPVLYVYTEADAGKVKRIRNNPKVRIAPCNFRGDLRGDWVEACARICDDPQESVVGQQLLRRKYGWQKTIGDFFSKLFGHKQAVLAIELV